MTGFAANAPTFAWAQFRKISARFWSGSLKHGICHASGSLVRISLLDPSSQEAGPQEHFAQFACSCLQQAHGSSRTKPSSFGLVLFATARFEIPRRLKVVCGARGRRLPKLATAFLLASRHSSEEVAANGRNRCPLKVVVEEVAANGRHRCPLKVLCRDC